MIEFVAFVSLILPKVLSFVTCLVGFVVLRKVQAQEALKAARKKQVKRDRL